MRIGICDDDINQIEQLTIMINENGNHQVFTYYSSEELFFVHANQNIPLDCLFLDIQMLEMNGIDCAKKIREFDEDIQIIFLTSIADFVFKGYEVNALRYILKPISQEKLTDILKLVEDKIKVNQQSIYVNKEKIIIDDIMYVESIGHYCEIVTVNNILSTKIAFKELLVMLENKLIQIHRSYLVNFKYVNSIKKCNCYLVNNKILPISRSFNKIANQKFIDYIKGDLDL